MLHIGHQREELDIELEGKILNQRDSFVYLGGAVCGDGKTERYIRRRVQAAANAWRAVARVMADRRFSKRLKGKFIARLWPIEELDRETDEEQITVGWTRRKDGR